MKIVEIVLLNEAQKELKKLSKKYKTLNKDFKDRFSLAVKDEELVHTHLWSCSEKIANTHCDKKIFYKLKKFRCEFTNSSREFRMIFFMIDSIMYIIQFYHKNKLDNCDYERIKKYCSYPDEE